MKLLRDEDHRTDNKGAVGVTVDGVLLSYLQHRLTARVGPPGVLATSVLLSLWDDPFKALISMLITSDESPAE